MAEVSAEAAGTAVDKVAEAESDQRARSEDASTSGSQHSVVEISDAVLQQRTYFVPTMVSILSFTQTHLNEQDLLMLDLEACHVSCFGHAMPLHCVSAADAH